MKKQNKTQNKQNKKGNRKRFRGVVVSDKMDKTIVVKVERFKLHKKFKKYYKVSKKYHVHDEKNQAKVGDQVIFEESRPISKTKKWRLIKIL